MENQDDPKFQTHTSTQFLLSNIVRYFETELVGIFDQDFSILEVQKCYLLHSVNSEIILSKAGEVDYV